MIEPNAVVLYVDNLAVSQRFYQDLLGLEPKEESPTFASFILSNGMSIGLKAKHSVLPAADTNGSGELAFTLGTNKQVDELFAKWQENGINIALPPIDVTYGYTFLALDPSGNRLRVVALAAA